MSESLSPPSDLLSFLRTSYPDHIPESFSRSDLPALSSTLYPKTSFTDPEKVELSQWLTTSARLATPDEDEAKHAERLGSLNVHLSTRTTLLGSKPSVADVALYHRLAPAVQAWTPQERTGEKGYHHIVRFVDFVQNSPVFGLRIAEADKIPIDVNEVLFVQKPLDPKEEKERKKKEKAAALAPTNGASLPQAPNSLTDRTKEPSSTASEPSKPAPETTASRSKKEKKEKAPKPQKQPPAAKEVPLSPSLIDLRVGHILKCIPHPNADSLYVSTIVCGDAEGTPETSLHTETGRVVRTVCSGLNGLIPIEEMQNRKVITVCNLKPVTMRGIKSAAMVLAASPRLKEGEEDNHKGPVELVLPPEGAEAGERCNFDGWEGEPEGVLNPKKKIWETCQVGFMTTEGREVGFDSGAVEQLKEQGKGLGRLVTESGGICTVKSLTGATVR